MKILLSFFIQTMSEFFKACVKGDYDKVDHEIEKNGVRVNAFDNYALCCACTYGNAKVIERLLKCEIVDPNACCDYPVLWASSKGYTDIIKILLSSNKIKCSVKYNLALLGALNVENFEIFKIISDFMKNSKVEVSKDVEKKYYELVKEYERKIEIVTDVEFCKSNVLEYLVGKYI
jgi:ankyrin repeat protein